MSKQYNIRWTDSDNAELRKAVKNFNAKITRLEKKNPKEKHLLPERVNMKELKQLIDTRQDLKREMNALRRFTKRGAEQIVELPDNDYNTKTTKWQKEEMTRRAAVINRKRKKRMKDIMDIELTSRGQKLGYTKGEFGMGKADMNQLKPINAFTPSMSTKDLKRKFQVLLSESQSTFWTKKEIQMKQNYMKAIAENFRPDDVKDLLDAIDQMDFQEFYATWEAEGASFDSVYFPDQEQQAQYLSALKATWMPNREAG